MTIEYETINKETPKMKQLISGIKKSKQTPSEYCTNEPSALREDTERLRDGSVSFCNKYICIINLIGINRRKNVQNQITK